MSAGGESRQLVLVQENVNTREAHAARKRQAFALQFVDIAWSKNEKITNERWHPDAKPLPPFSRIPAATAAAGGGTGQLM